MSKPGFVFALAVSAALSQPAVAAAQGTPSGTVTTVAPDVPTGWRFELQPFAWIPMNVSGDATVLDRQVEIDVSAADVLDNLEMAANLRFEAWKNQIGLVVEGMYARLGSEASETAVPFELTSRTFVADALGAYRVGPRSMKESGSMTLDIFAGARIVYLDQDLQIAASDLSADEVNLKGVGAMRGLLRLNPTWVVAARATLAVPDLGWNVAAGFEADASFLAFKFRLRRRRSVILGDRLELDTFAHGPYLAIGFRFGAGPIY